jgi:hypothetical protein
MLLLLLRKKGTISLYITVCNFISAKRNNIFCLYSRKQIIPNLKLNFYVFVSVRLDN